jgi:DNA-directed RNA polymerase subunit beta
VLGFERRDILEILTLLKKLKFLKQEKKYIGRKLAARVLNTWHEDFVDEDTGEWFLERNEIILDRDTIIDKDNVEELILTLNLFCYTKC